ncbi:MAG: hypothetical protein UU93_C0004G0012 [Candidatus Amesbacteria bacterium GW2011_GWA2_42_12]|uniref:Uncharacterized protein n=1 Tax=Candidatus Amesbacteria bacterium GW2011_GWA2_42_12 TaxID=1618356 RepID=A0A0G0Y8D9_9BACT|nr:MAG: hypothetical protein UU93_C0004G0012 [Candidatus Amesbacteria bacterium GW2011_GWA2_42_12]
MKSLKQLIDEKKPVDRNKFVSREFQDYGYRLAEEFSDMAHKSLYIRLAKTVDRALLEKARSFVSDSNAHNKGALFMWKLKELKKSVSPRPS